MRALLLLPTLLLSGARIPGDDASWETLLENPVRVECTTLEGEPWCRSSGLLRAPIDEVARALEDMRYNASAFKSIVRIDNLDATAIRVVLDYPPPLDDRDYVSRYTSLREGEARIVRWTPVVHPDAPVEPGIVRLPRFAGEWRLLPCEGGTLVRYTWQAEIAGSFPSFGYPTARRRAGTEALLDLARVRKARLDPPPGP
jgi:hypothetical protein